MELGLFSKTEPKSTLSLNNPAQKLISFMHEARFLSHPNPASYGKINLNLNLAITLVVGHSTNIQLSYTRN
jgi:hypothetical protein